jgi:hypothetical protein
MHYQTLTKLKIAFFFCYFAALAGIIISFKDFAALGVPIWAMPVRTIPINKIGVILFDPMSISTCATTIFPCTLMTICFAFCKVKSFMAIQTEKLSIIFWPLLYGCILTFRRTMFTSTVLETACNSRKLFTAMFAF